MRTPSKWYFTLNTDTHTRRAGASAGERMGSSILFDFKRKHNKYTLRNR